MAQGQLDLTRGYTDGSLSQIFSKLGTPSVNVTVTVDGSTSKFVNSTPRNDPRGLWLSLNLGDNLSDKVSVTFVFSDPVVDLTFGIRGIDKEQSFSNYQDKVIVEGFDAQNKRTIPSIGYHPLYATVTDGDSAGIKIITGLYEDQYDSTLASVSYRGAGIKRLRLTYTSGQNIRPGTITLQNVFITPLSWANIVPVQLMYLRGKAANNKTLLEWATATEINSDKFVVQRSTNLKDFSDLGQISSAGDSRTQKIYSFTDDGPLPGVNYYRLKTLDKDGTFDFSKIIAVNLQSDAPRFVIYPNPSDGRSINLQFDNLDLSGLRLSDLVGRELAFDIQPSSSNGIVIRPLQKLKTGVYVLRVLGQTSVSQKILVQE